MTAGRVGLEIAFVPQLSGGRASRGGLVPVRLEGQAEWQPCVRLGGGRLAGREGQDLLVLGSL